MKGTTSKSEQDGALGVYWRGVGICLVLLGIYLAAIFLFGTETWKRTTAPPWYSWVRYPPTRTRAQALYLVFPAIVFTGWTWIARRMIERPMPALLAMGLACIAVFAMNSTVAMIDGGPRAIYKPFEWGGSEYFDDVRYVIGIRTFLRGYVENMYHYSIHSRTHPPGPVIFLYFVKCLFGGGVATAAWSAVIVTATAVVPFYLLARDLAGERVARVAAAIYAVVPSLVLFGATSMDGVFLVPLMWSMYFMRRVVARPNIRNAIGAGIALAVSLMLSYVTVCVGTMMVLYAIMEVSVDAKRIWRVAGAYAISAGVIVLSLWLINVTSGFNYLKCFEASRYFDHYLMRTFHISFGRYLDISFSNLVAFLIGVGLPVVVLWWKKIWKWDRFVTAGTIAVIGFSFAKLFTRETERIWLFFAPVAVLGAASCIGRLGSSQRRVLEWVMGLLFAQVWLFQVFLYTIW